MVNDFNQLYYRDAYQQEFTAEVLDVLEKKGKQWLCLTQTCFYPLGGGQPGDQGVLIYSDHQQKEEMVQVLDTCWIDQQIWHEVDQLIPVQTKIKGKINFARRYDFMQQHSGEHIISGIVNQKYGYHNVGFHINEEETTFDFDGKLTLDEIEQLEIEANQAIQKNIPIEIKYLTHEEQKNINYRSKLDLKEDVRLIVIEGYDQCACAGTHLKSTCEIGLIKIIKKENYKQGVRLTVLCGNRALKYFQKLNCITNTFTERLSANTDELINAFDKQIAEIQNLKSIINEKNKEWIDLFLKSVEPTDSHIILENKHFDKTDWKFICRSIIKKNNGIASILTQTANNKYILYMYSEEIDLRQYADIIRQNLNFKGGGNAGVLQGPVEGDIEKIKEKLSELR